MAEFAVTPHINVQNDIGFGKTVLMPGPSAEAMEMVLGRLKKCRTNIEFLVTLQPER